MAEEYVIMPKADYVAACDAIRRKTGKTAAIKSSELAEEIVGIEGSGTTTDEIVRLPSKVVYYNNFNGTVVSKLNMAPKVVQNSEVVDFSDTSLWGESKVVNMNPSLQNVVYFEKSNVDESDPTYVSNGLQGGVWSGLTIGAWFRRKATINTYSRIISMSGNAGLKSIYSTPNSEALNCDGNGKASFFSAQSMQWNHIAMSFTPSSDDPQNIVQDVIVNGTIMATGVLSSQSIDYNIVSIANGTYYFNGDMKNLFLSMGALTLEEVRQMMLRD